MPSSIVKFMFLPGRRLGKNKLLLAVGIILFVGFLVTNLSAYWVSRQTIREGISNQALMLTGDNIYSEIQKDLLNPVLISSLMSHDTLLRDWLLHGESDKTQITRYLAEVRNKYETVTSFLVSERTRVYYHPSGAHRLISENNPSDAWYFRVRDAVEDYEINVDSDHANEGALTIFINYRVHDFKGNFIGVTGVGLTFNTVSKLTESYQSRFGRRVYFVDKSGSMVLGGDRVMRGHLTIRDVNGLADIADQILNEHEEPTQLEYYDGSERVLLNSRFIKELGWYLLVEQSEENDMRSVSRLLYVNLALGGSTTVVVVILVLSMISRYRQRLEKVAKTELQIARNKQSFLAFFSHEIRNHLASLNAVISNLVIQGVGLPGKYGQRFIKLKLISNQLGELVENFLADSNLENIAFKPAFESIDANELLRQTVLGFEVGGRIVVEPPSNARVPIYGDWSLLRLAIQNLLNNALKYSPAGSEVTAFVRRSDDFVELGVADQGVGIPEGERDRIFEPFFRGSGKRFASGSGLGLALVKKIADLHGGAVDVQSRAEHGSIFIIRLPVSVSSTSDSSNVARAG